MINVTKNYSEKRYPIEYKDLSENWNKMKYKNILLFQFIIYSHYVASIHLYVKNNIFFIEISS